MFKASTMSIKYSGLMYWAHDKEWYYIDYERDRYVLTDKAPEEARRSFDLWEKVNGVKWDEE